MRDFTCSVSREHFTGLSNLTSNQQHLTSNNLLAISNLLDIDTIYVFRTLSHICDGRFLTVTITDASQCPKYTSG